MSNKGYKKTKEHIEKIMLKTRGKKRSLEVIEKMREAKLKNPTRYWLGKKRNLETINKFKKSHLGQKAWNKGIKLPKMSGDKHPMWKGGISREKGYSSIYKKRYKSRKRGATGLHTAGEWDLLKKQYNMTCPCCKRSEPEIKLTEDHIIPLSKGGSDNIENIQPLCRPCNCRKNNKIIKKYNI